jgi:hypothetical protein
MLRHKTIIASTRILRQAWPHSAAACRCPVDTATRATHGTGLLPARASSAREPGETQMHPRCAATSGRRGQGVSGTVGPNGLNRSARRWSGAQLGPSGNTSLRSASVSRWPCCRGRRAERSYRSIPRPSSCSSSIRRRSWRRFSASSSRPSAESIRARSPFEATAGRSPWPRGSRTAARRRSS